MIQKPYHIFIDDSPLELPFTIPRSIAPILGSQAEAHLCSNPSPAMLCRVICQIPAKKKAGKKNIQDGRGCS